MTNPANIIIALHSVDDEARARLWDDLVEVVEDADLYVIIAAPSIWEWELPLERVMKRINYDMRSAYSQADDKLRDKMSELYIRSGIQQLQVEDSPRMAIKFSLLGRNWIKSTDLRQLVADQVCLLGPDVVRELVGYLWAMKATDEDIIAVAKSLLAAVEEAVEKGNVTAVSCTYNFVSRLRDENENLADQLEKSHHWFQKEFVRAAFLRSNQKV